MKRKLPQSLLEKQESERAATAAAITDAAIMLQSQGCNIRIKDLMDITGFSRSVFAKPHIRRVLVEYGAIVPKDVTPSNVAGKARRDVETILAEKDGYIDRLLFEIQELQKECEILRGRIHLLTHKKSLKDEADF
jgi:hypothetical protein